VSDHNIESTLHENRLFAPAAEFTARARLKPADVAALRARAEADFTGFWAEHARRELVWCLDPAPGRAARKPAVMAQAVQRRAR
jgi:hypothetical protein